MMPAVIDLSPDAWGAVGIGITTAGATIGAIVVAHLKTSRQARGIADHVEDVRKLAEPTGNGFADKTIAKLDRALVLLEGVTERVQRIEERHVRTESALVEHLGDHTRASLNREDTKNHD